MDLTIKAILARFNGDYHKAVQYCNRTADGTSNPALQREYNVLGQAIYLLSRPKAVAANA